MSHDNVCFKRVAFPMKSAGAWIDEVEIIKKKRKSIQIKQAEFQL